MITFDSTRNRFVCEVDRRIKGTDGKIMRVRKRKILPKGTTEEDAFVMARKFEADLLRPYLASSSSNGWDEHVDALTNNRQSWIYKTLAKCRSRRSCSLTPPQLSSLLRRSRGRCMVTGIPFRFDTVGDSKRKPYSYSLDRIDSSKGYSEDNCRVVCYAVNLAMLSWGEEVLQDIAVGYVLNRYGALGRSMEDGHHFTQPNFAKQNEIRLVSG